MESVDGPESGVGALSLPGRIAVAVVVGLVAVGALYHLAMVFLYVAPSNTLSKEHTTAVNNYIYPEFEQNWKLFAPDPLQQNIHVEARAQVRKPGGAQETTGWVDMTGRDVAAMRHDPAPSHSQQNELRRAWGYYSDNHASDTQAAPGDRSDMSRVYLLQIMEKRFGHTLNGGQVERIQIRVATTPVAQPPWIAGSSKPTPQYRTLPWWTADYPSGKENAS